MGSVFIESFNNKNMSSTLSTCSSDIISDSENERILQWQRRRAADFEKNSSENDENTTNASSSSKINTDTESNASSMDLEKYRQRTKNGRKTDLSQFTKSTVAFMPKASPSKERRKAIHGQDTLDQQYAKQFRRNSQRRGAICKAKEDHKQAIELQALLDTERGLPCKTKNGSQSSANLAEINYRERKREALIQEKGQTITPEQAYDLLMCKYVRLTPSNIESLKLTARFGGYDTQFHPHMTEDELSEHIEDFCISHE